MSDAEIVNKDNLLQSIYKQKKLKDSPEKKETDDYNYEKYDKKEITDRKNYFTLRK